MLQEHSSGPEQGEHGITQLEPTAADIIVSAASHGCLDVFKDYLTLHKQRIDDLNAALKAPCASLVHAGMMRAACLKRIAVSL